MEAFAGIISYKLKSAGRVTKLHFFFAARCATLEVHPIKGYGAIEIGSHRFSHGENGKDVSGTFKFMMVWKEENGNWRISRVVSYDH
jgi:hypothetical protein